MKRVEPLVIIKYRRQAGTRWIVRENILAASSAAVASPPRKQPIVVTKAVQTVSEGERC